MNHIIIRNGMGHFECVKHPSFSSMEELASVKLGMIAYMHVESECVQ